MKRGTLVLVTFGFLLLTMNPVAQSAHPPRDPQACSAAEPPDLTDESMRWRLRAYNNLDCLMSKLEQASNRPDNAGRSDVKLSRQEIEQLMNLAWWAKDAAQRIGR
jgi:hypothetical protein